MGEEIVFKNGRISDFQGIVTMTLTLDRVILHIVMHHSSTYTYIQNFIEIEETFCGWTDGRTYGRADRHLRPALLGRLRGVDLKRPSIDTVLGRAADSNWSNTNLQWADGGPTKMIAVIAVRPYRSLAGTSR